MTDSSKIVVNMLCIYYLVQFHKNLEWIKALLNSDSEVNAMNFKLARKLCFHIQKTNVGAQNIDGSIFETFKIIIIYF